MKDEEKYLCKKCKKQVIFVGEKNGEYIYNCKNCQNMFTKDKLKIKKEKK